MAIYARKWRTRISTHSPRVGRTLRACVLSTAYSAISTHSPRVGRTSLIPDHLTKFMISTHSPRVGRTKVQSQPQPQDPHFNSLAPCGANPFSAEVLRNLHSFQLTRPVWGEPSHRRIASIFPKHFNSLAPCGANPHLSPLFDLFF